MAPKKEAKDQEPKSGLKVTELMGISRAIDIVAQMAFPMTIQYNLAKIKGQLETPVKAYNKAINELRESLRVKKNDQWIIPDKNLEQWRNESDALSDEVNPDLKLRTFKMSDFDFTEDDHYADTKVPQEFITLMFPLLTE